jgi:TIR domain-containing protein
MRTLYVESDSRGARLANIFISYRREDTGGHAGRLCDRLTARFGDARVFMDIQDLHPGQNFATSIDETIATCDCVIAVIGPRWLEAVQKRAQSPDDFVRREIGAALKRRITVIPVLVGGAHMPAASELPQELAELSFRNAIEIRDERFDADVEQLDAFLAGELHVPANPALRSRARAARLGSAITLLILAGAIAAYLRLGPPGRGGGGDAPPAAAASPAAIIDGEWVALMQKPGREPYRIRLRFQRVGNSLGGMVQYPTGDGPMHDVALNGRALTFTTTHVPQFESSAATVRFQGDVIDADRIQLMSTDDSGVATGVAERRAAR